MSIVTNTEGILVYLYNSTTRIGSLQEIRDGHMSHKVTDHSLPEEYAGNIISCEYHHTKNRVVFLCSDGTFFEYDLLQKTCTPVEELFSAKTDSGIAQRPLQPTAEGEKYCGFQLGPEGQLLFAQTANYIEVLDANYCKVSCFIFLFNF